MGVLRAICLYLALVVASGTVAGVAFGQSLNPRDDDAGLLRALQIDLADLSQRVTMLRQGAGAGSPLGDILTTLDRIRAADMLLAERNRQLEQRLLAEGASAQVQQRHRDNVRVIREGLDRVYAAAAPMTESRTDSGAVPLDAAGVRSVLDALAGALAPASPRDERIPLSATLPHRPLSLPQAPLAVNPPIVPAYLAPDPVLPVAADSAETEDATFGPLVRAKASELGRDPIAIFEFVRNGIETEFYYGSMKSAEQTLREAGGNDLDQASLLIALLRASGIPARYVRGVAALGGTQAIGMTGVGSTRRVAEVFTRAGIPFRPIVQGGAIASFEIEHAWVEAYVSYSNYRGAPLGATGQAWIPLDPSFKMLDLTPGEDITAAIGVTPDALVAEYLSSLQTKPFLEFYEDKIRDYLTASRPDLTFEQALATATIHAVRAGLLANTLPYDVIAVHQELTEVPDGLKHHVRFTAEGEGGVSFDVTIPASRLAGQRLTLSYVPATVEDQNAANAFLGLDSTPAFLVKLRPVLKINGIVEAAGATPIQMGAMHAFTLEMQLPRQTVPIVNQIVAGGYYAIGLGTGRGRYETPQVRAPDDTEHPAADRLYGLASTYHEQWRASEDALGRILRVVTVRPMLAHVMTANAYTRTLLFGQPQALDWRGVFVDADLHVAEAIPIGADNARAPAFMRLSGLAGSMLEGDVLQLDLGVDAVSAARLIQLARAGGVAVDEIDAANIATALPLIQTGAIVKTEIADAVNQGWRVTIPRHDLSRHAWTGIGYIMLDPATGAGGYFISGGFAGGETTQTPEEWAEEVADQLGTPYQDNPNTDPTSAHSILRILSTDGQKGTAGQSLPMPIAVWVRDAEGRPVKNALVRFQIVAGGGRFENLANTLTVESDQKGIARVNVELGQKTADAPFYVKANPEDQNDTLVGENLVTASVQASGGQIPLDAPFQLFGFPGAPANLLKVLAPEGLITVGTAAGTLRVRVVDAHDNPISNVPVTFNVLPAVPGEGTLPPSAINLKLYFRAACDIPVPLVNDCNGVDQTTVRTSLWGAQVEAILGDTLDTKFRVRASTENTALSTEFELSSGGRRSGVGTTVTATLLQLVNDRGQLLNAAEVGTPLPRPLEVVVVAIDDNYRVESTGDPCSPSGPECRRIVALGTTRVRPVDIAAEGFVDFPGLGGAVIQGPRKEESVRITFAVPVGAAQILPPVIELPEHGLGRGRYPSNITVGAQPALNRILIEPVAHVWAAQFDPRSSNPITLIKAAMLPGSRVGVNSPNVVPADFYPTTLEHDVFSVRASVLDDERVLLSETGASLADLDIEYVIEPALYDADLAQVDLLEENGDTPIRLGFLPGTSTSGEGHGRLHRGAGGFDEGIPFDATRNYQTQLVLNRGGEAEIISEPKDLGVYLAGPLGADFRARENTGRESRRKAIIPLEDGLREEQKKLATLIKKGLDDGASCGVPIQQIAILEQGSGACFWSDRFNFGDRDATPAVNPDPVGACSGFQPGISDHDYEVLIPRHLHTGPGGPAACVVDKLNHAAEDPELDLGSVSFFRVSIEELFEGKLNIDPPPSGGSDAVGDVGLGRQTLLFKWALEGEWVTELVTKIAGDVIPGLRAPEVTVGGQRVPLLDYVIDTLRTTPTIEGETTGIPKLEGFEWGVLQHFNFFKAGAHVGLTGKSVDPKSHLYALRQEAIHNAAKAGIRAATGRLLASEVGNPFFLDTSRARYRSVGGCVTGAENPSNPPPLAELFPKPCDSFEEYIASTAILDARVGTPIFTADELLTIYQFYRIKEDIECAAADCQTEITSEEAANRFLSDALNFIRDSVLSNPAVTAAYNTGLPRPGSERAKRESNRDRANAGRVEAAETVSYQLEARVFNDNALELQSIPLNMYPQPPPPIGYVVPRIVGRASPPTGEIHDPRWTDTIVDVQRDFAGEPIPHPENGRPQPVYDWEIDATAQHPAWFVLDPSNTVKECNKTDNRSAFIAYPIDMNNAGAIPDVAGLPGPPVTTPETPPECVSQVPSLQVTKLVNNQAEITVTARTPVSVRHVVTNTGAVPLQGVQVVDLLTNTSYPPFPLAPGETKPLEGEFRSSEVGKQFVGPTEVLAFVPDTIIPGGQTISAWDSVRVNVVNPSCSIAIAPPSPDPNRYTSDGRPMSTVMQGGDVYRYYKAYGARPGARVELMVDEEPLEAVVDDDENIAHYEPDPESTTGATLRVQGLEIPHGLIGTRGIYDLRFVSVGGTTSVCSDPFQIEVTNREFTRGFEAGGAIDAAGTILLGINGKAGASLDVKITEQLGPTRSKLAISRSMDAKLGVQAGIASPSFKLTLPGVRAQVGASAEATLAGLLMGGDTHEFKYQPNSTDLAQKDAAALGALILATVADKVPVVGKIGSALVNHLNNFDQYKTTDTLSLGLKSTVGGEAAAIAGLATFNKSDNRRLGELKYGVGGQASASVGAGGTVSLDSKPLAGELVPGFKVNVEADFGVSLGVGELSEDDEVDEETQEKAVKLKDKLKTSIKGSVAGSKGAKLTLDTNNDFKATKLTFSVAPKKSFGWDVAGDHGDLTLIDNESDDVTFTYTFTDPDMLAEAIDQLTMIHELRSIGSAAVAATTGVALGPTMLVVQLHKLWLLAAQHDGAYEAVTKVGHGTEIPLGLDLGAGAKVKVSGGIKFDRSISFHSEKGTIRSGISYTLERYTDDQWIPDLQDLEDFTDLFEVSIADLREEIGPVVDVVQQAVAEFLNTVRSNNTAELTFDGSTAPFPQIGIASYKFEPTPGPVTPGLQLPEDSSGPADAPHYGIGGFHQFLPEGQQLTAPAPLKIYYDDSELAGIDEQTLGVYEWNPATGDWDHLGGTVDPVANTVTTAVRRMSLYTAAPPMPGGRFTMSAQSTPSGTPSEPKTTITATSNTIRMNTGVVVPDGTRFTVRALTPQGTDLTSFGTITSTDLDPLLDGIQVQSVGGVVRFTVDVPGSVGGVRFLVYAVKGTSQADQIVTY